MEDWSDLGSVLDLLDNEIQQSSEFHLLYEDLWERLKNNPYYPLVNDGLVTDFKINLEDWTEKELSMSDRLGTVLQYDDKRARGSKEISVLAYDGGSERLAAHFFLDAFVHIEAGRRGWARWAMICIRGAYKYVKQCEAQGLHPDYQRGVDYLIRWTLLHIYLKKGKIPSRMEEDFDALVEYECLPDRAKAIVLAPKAFLLASFRNYSSQAEEQGKVLLRKVVELDPASFIWSYTLGNWLRNCRRRTNYLRTGGPCLDEIWIVTKSYEAALAQFNPDVPEARINNSKDVGRGLASMCQLVAEMFKAWDRHMKQIHFPVQIGDILLNKESTERDISSFVLDNVKRLNSEDKEPIYTVLIRSAEILCNTLPKMYRDYEAAEKYLLKALETAPRNKSKVFHKLGILYLVSPIHRNVDKALGFFRSAVESGPNNFPALCDLTLTLMGQREVHKVELDENVRKALTEFVEKQITGYQKGQFYFFHGCLKFMRGEKVDAVRSWIIFIQSNRKLLFHD